MGDCSLEILKKNGDECEVVVIRDENDFVDLDENEQEVKEIFELAALAEDIGIYIDFNTLYPPVFTYLEPKVNYPNLFALAKS